MTDDAPNPSPEAQPSTRDRPGLADVMILVASFALGFAWLRVEQSSAEVGWMFATPYGAMRSNDGGTVGRFDRSVPVVATVTLGLVLVMLRKPGAMARSTPPGLGLVACVSASVPIVYYLARGLFSMATVGGMQSSAFTNPVETFGPLMTDLASPAGAAVVAGWLAARLGPARVVQPGLIDNAGRIVGIYWTAAVAGRLVYEVAATLRVVGLP